MKILRASLGTLLCFVMISGRSQPGGPLFQLLPAAQTGISFNNTITESDSLNILTQANIYYGGGVGIGDFNGDGLQDVYLAGNMVSSKLYINKGGLQFADQTAAAGVRGEGRWCTGVTVVDINADGRPDIYVAASFSKDPLLRTNLLYINQGNDASGIPMFKEMAEAYGIADNGFSTQGYFFDYDRDGDLDLYIVTNALYDPKTPIRFRPKLTDGSAQNTDRLYRNNGDQTFTNVSREAGITIEGWGHAACITDINHDGWPDVYVANDFVSNDLLYINNHDGSFTNQLDTYFKHTGWNAMGSDMVDINNDGYNDLISLEMLPEDNLRKKRMQSGNEYYNYFNAAQFGYKHQYVRNVLQVSSGETNLGHPVYSDIGFMAGVYQTDWSWCPLVADFDNDGYRDMIISNGLPRDVTDLDYIAYDNGQGGGKANLSLAAANQLPVVHIPNYAFKNKDGRLFENVTKSWGLGDASFSNGSAYADLDNDGDLDVIVNNINNPAFVYENLQHYKPGKTNEHALTIQLVGTGQNRDAIGTNVTVFTNGKQLFYEHQPSRGYMSTMDSRAHFGLGNAHAVDSIKVQWPDGKTTRLAATNAGQTLILKQANASSEIFNSEKKPTIFKTVNGEHQLHYKPVETDFIDYNIQPTLPHKLSQYGPGTAVGDIDKNGYEDFYIGGSSGNPGLFFMQDAKGIFTADKARIPRAAEELQEEMGVLLFDADNDGDLDLYTVTGSYEIPPGNAVVQDRLFINDGTGHYKLNQQALPEESVNGSCVRAADFDGDGDLDLFVGGRVVSGAYPQNPRSFIYRNNGGRFTDVTNVVCPQLQEFGMITDALWSDFDNDGKVDLVVTGEWMAVSFFKNNGTTFSLLSTAYDMPNHLGWWNSLTAGDFDNDGDIDYVAGNLGLNSNYCATAKEPMTLLAKDLDQNGSLDIMLFCYMMGSDSVRRAYPMHTKDDLASQLLYIRKKYPTYKSFGMATMNELWGEPARKDAIKKVANDMQSAYFENNGNGKFVIKALPLAAQEAPIYGMLAEDIDDDGNLDLLLVGNDYGMEPYSGRHDALNGVSLKGDGKGGFTEMPLSETGFFVPGDGKGLAKIYTANNDAAWLATQNQDSLLLFAKRPGSTKGASKLITLQPGDLSATIYFRSGTHRKQEFYYGSTYLSQSTRHIAIDDNIQKMIITNFKGQKRTVQ